MTAIVNQASPNREPYDSRRFKEFSKNNLSITTVEKQKRPDYNENTFQTEKHIASIVISDVIGRFCDELIESKALSKDQLDFEPTRYRVNVIFGNINTSHEIKNDALRKFDCIMRLFMCDNKGYGPAAFDCKKAFLNWMKNANPNANDEEAVHELQQNPRYGQFASRLKERMKSYEDSAIETMKNKEIETSDELLNEKIKRMFCMKKFADDLEKSTWAEYESDMNVSMTTKRPCKDFRHEFIRKTAYSLREFCFLRSGKDRKNTSIPKDN